MKGFVPGLGVAGLRAGVRSSWEDGQAETVPWPPRAAVALSAGRGR